MNTGHTSIISNERGRYLGAARALAGVALTVVAAGCSVTQKETPVLAGGTCALIPPQFCSQLVPGPKEGAGLRYIAPDVQWSQYTKVLVTPVTAWGGDTTKLSPADRRRRLSLMLVFAVIIVIPPSSRVCAN